MKALAAKLIKLEKASRGTKTPVKLRACPEFEFELSSDSLKETDERTSSSQSSDAPLISFIAPVGVLSSLNHAETGGKATSGRKCIALLINSSDNEDVIDESTKELAKSIYYKMATKYENQI